MILPVQSPPVSLVSGPTAAAASQSKLPISPVGAQATGAAIDANLGGIGGLPRPPTSPRDRALTAMDVGEKWAANLNRLADFTGVDLGSALNFAHADVRRLVGDLNHQAPDGKLTRDTERLVGDWATRSRPAFQALRHGMFRNAEQDVGQAARTLQGAGVQSPEIQGALRDLNVALRQADFMQSHSPSRPGGPGFPGPIFGGGTGLALGDPLGRNVIGPPTDPGLGMGQVLIDQAMAKLGQAMSADARAHPEHMQALQQSVMELNGGLRQMYQGLATSRSMEQGLMQDLQRLSGQLQPLPGPRPLPFPGLQAQPTNAARGIAPAEPQAA